MERPSATTEAYWAFYRLREHLQAYYASQPGAGGPGVDCDVCRGHVAGSADHRLCADLKNLADLEMWVTPRLPEE